jgi:hypothetical protein
MMFSVPFAIFAQRVSLPDGTAVCRVSASGTVSDGNGATCCKFARNGVIFDSCGDVAGRVSGNEVRDGNGCVAIYFKGGCVFDRFHVKIGTVSGGRVYDSTGRLIGRYSNVRPVYVAVIFFARILDVI